MEKEKRLLEDVPSEILVTKLRRANSGMTQAIAEEILFRGVFVDDGKDRPKIQYIDPLDYKTKKQISDEEFSKQVEEMSKHFKADIYDTCGKCCKLTKNNVCENCKASNTQIES